MAWEELLGHDLSDWDFWKRRGYTDEDLARAESATSVGGPPAGPPPESPGPTAPPAMPTESGDLLTAMAQAMMETGGEAAMAAPPQEPWGWKGGNYYGWDVSQPSFNPNAEGGQWENPIEGDFQEIPNQEAGVDPRTGLIVWRAGDEGRYYPSPQSQSGERATLEQLLGWGITPSEGYQGGTFSPDEMGGIQGMAGRADWIKRQQEKIERADKRQMAITVASILAAAVGGMYFGAPATAATGAEAGAAAGGLEVGGSTAGFTGGAVGGGTEAASFGPLLADAGTYGTDAAGPYSGWPSMGDELSPWVSPAENPLGASAASGLEGAAPTEAAAGGSWWENILKSAMADPLRTAGVGMMATGLLGQFLGGDPSMPEDLQLPEPIPIPTGAEGGGEEEGGDEAAPFEAGPAQFQGATGQGVPTWTPRSVVQRTGAAAMSGTPPSQIGGPLGSIAQQAMDITRSLSPSFDTTRQFSELLATIQKQITDLPGIHPEDIDSLAMTLEASQLSLMDHDIAKSEERIREAANRLGENPAGRLAELDFATTIARQEIHATARRDALGMVAAQQQLALGQITPELQMAQLLDPYKYFSAQASLFGSVFGTLGGLAGQQMGLQAQSQEAELSRQFQSGESAAMRALQERLGMLDAQTRSRLAEFAAEQQGDQFSQAQALDQARFAAQQQQFQTQIRAQQDLARRQLQAQRDASFYTGLGALGGTLFSRSPSLADILASLGR